MARRSRAEVARLKAAARREDAELRRLALEDDSENTPAMNFFFKQIESTAGLSLRKAEHKAALELLASDIPLTQEDRVFMSAVLRPRTAVQERRKEVQSKLWSVEFGKIYHYERGHSMREAEVMTAEGLEFGTGEKARAAMLKFEQRARKLLGK